MESKLKESIIETIEEAFASRAFSRRRWSWIAIVEDLFLKIPVAGNKNSSVETDARDAASKGIAESEYENLAFLSTLSDSLVRPIAVIRDCACLVLPFIKGENAWTLLQRQRTTHHRAVLQQAMELIGMIHRSSYQATEKLPVKDYQFSYPSDKGVVVIEGFEIRNLMVDNRGKMWLYDPHHIYAGYAEDDVSRFVISLLMLNWGRHVNCRIWTNFVLNDLLHFYEIAAERSINDDLFSICFWNNVARRELEARHQIADMTIWKRPFAIFYLRYFVIQLRKWALKNGL